MTNQGDQESLVKEEQREEEEDADDEQEDVTNPAKYVIIKVDLKSVEMITQY